MSSCFNTAFRYSYENIFLLFDVLGLPQSLDHLSLFASYSILGFPANEPTVYELYWSPSQVLARAHPNLRRTQAFLMSHWHSDNKSARISTSHPVAYADRLRIRQPGDAGFALGPHVDGGSCERWLVVFPCKASVASDLILECYDTFCSDILRSSSIFPKKRY